MALFLGKLLVMYRAYWMKGDDRWMKRTTLSCVRKTDKVMELNEISGNGPALL